MLRLSAAMLAGTALVHAAEITTFTVPIPSSVIADAGSAFELPVPQFDPTGGRVLQQVDLTLTLDLSGQMGFENLDDSLSAIYTLTIDWDIQLVRPDTSLLTQITATRTRNGLVNPYDGTTDFDGPSGVTLDVEAPDQSADFSTTDAADLSLFTGPGTVTLGLLASFTGTASSTPVVEFDSQFAAELEGQLEVQYTWIPEPAVATLLLAGFWFAGPARRRR